ncbi:hypothetical protein AcW1_009952 [Taiwanofungus camphoratus]|nr:hypothetical protein AcW1_009952 [Antrodia cinnamomea]
MTQSVSDSTFSPTPFSPFSSYSVASGVTSDDAPDLGAFTTVFRALNTFQPRTAPVNITNVRSTTTTSSLAFSPSDYDSEVIDGSTVWSRRPVASYLSHSSPDSVSRGRSIPTSDTDSTASDLKRTDPQEVEGVGDADTVDQPSLGYLDEALGFIAAERAKFVAQRDLEMRGIDSVTTSDSVWQYTIQPRRTRRRKKNRSVQEVSRVRILEQEEETHTEMVTNASDKVKSTVVNYDDDVYDSSSSQDILSSSPNFKSTPATPPHNKKEKRRQKSSVIKANPHIHHSKSTPNLLLPVSIPIDARVLHLRNLAHKLRLFFPQDTSSLNSILRFDTHESSTLTSSGFIDTRGPVPQSQDTLIHVFIDHSNILIGFLTYLRCHPHDFPRNWIKHISHAALALILERGRPITRRVLVASSPLYQPMDEAEQLGYEVRVYARVPDTGGRADRQYNHNSNNNSNSNSDHSHHSHAHPLKGKSRKGVPAPSQGHSHKTSLGGGGTSTESEPGPGGSTRVRYREQGVDELLQLKILQAVADVDTVSPGATIVLATGDGNVGQYNEEGFLGCVRTALKKGWRVELYAWEGGLSRAWEREFGRGLFSSRFHIHMLDRFAQDLLEI